MRAFKSIAPKKLTTESEYQSKHSVITTRALPIGMLALAVLLCKVALEPSSVRELKVLLCLFGFALPLILTGSIGMVRNIKYQKKILDLERNAVGSGAEWNRDMENLKLQKIPPRSSDFAFLDQANLGLLGNLVGWYHRLFNRRNRR